MFAEMAEAKFFRRLDTEGGFWQTPHDTEHFEICFQITILQMPLPGTAFWNPFSILQKNTPNTRRSPRGENTCEWHKRNGQLHFWKSGMIVESTKNWEKKHPQIEQLQIVNLKLIKEVDRKMNDV